jgi:hypothetical protein
MHIQDALQTALNSATVAERTLCLVVDTAAAEGGHATLDRWNVLYHSLFDGTPEESLLEIAPLLVPVNGLDAEACSRVFTWAQKLSYAAPCLSWIETDAPPAAMAEHLRRFHVVGLSEGQSLLMRWYDTRILPVWLACMTAVQSQAFTAHVSSWAYVDRLGEVSLAAIERSPAYFPPAPAYGEPLVTLTDAQYGMLIDATELDVLLKHLRQIIRDELKRVPARTLTQFVSKYQQAAISAGLDDIDRQAQYLMVALYTSGKGVEDPAFSALMKSPAPTLDELAKGIQDLPDEAWDAGSPLWDSATNVSAQTAQN